MTFTLPVSTSTPMGREARSDAVPGIRLIAPGHRDEEAGALVCENIS